MAVKRAAAHIPNGLTVLRLALTPLAGTAILHEDYVRALAWCIALGLTDLLDGFLARRFRWTSRWGAYLDPLADKLLLGTVYVCLGWVGAVPAWLVFLIFGRDTAILAGTALLAAKRGVRRFPPTFLGKLSTTLQIVGAAGVLGLNAFLDRPWPAAVTGLFVLLMTLVTIGTITSGADYIRRGWKVLRLQHPPESD